MITNKRFENATHCHFDERKRGEIFGHAEAKDFSR